MSQKTKTIIITTVITALILLVTVLVVMLWKSGQSYNNTNNSYYSEDENINDVSSNTYLEDTQNITNNDGDVSSDNKKAEYNDSCKDDNKAYFFIPELGIRILVDKSIKDDLIYKYEQIDDKTKTAYISFESLIKKSEGDCLPENGGAFAVTRINTQALPEEWRNQMSRIKRIGDDYITFDRQDRCSILDDYETPLIKKSLEVASNNYECIEELGEGELSNISNDDNKHANEEHDNTNNQNNNLLTGGQRYSYKNGKLSFIFSNAYKFNKKESDKIDEHDVGYALPKKDEDVLKLYSDEINSQGEISDSKADYMDNEDHYRRLKKNILEKKVYFQDKEGDGYKRLTIYLFDFNTDGGNNWFAVDERRFLAGKKALRYKSNIPNGFYKSLVRSDTYRYVREEILIPIGHKMIGIEIWRVASRDEQFDKNKFQQEIEEELEQILDTVKVGQ